jgi:hypothetical protein
MGNVCCIGRSQALKKPESIEVPQDSKKKVKKSEKKPSDKPPISTKKNNWQSALGLQTSPMPEEESSLVYSSDSGPELDYKDEKNAEKVFSRKSEIEEGLDCNLIFLDSLSKLQQTQIKAALNEYKSLIPEYEQEQVEGLLNLTDQKNKTMMLTTHAIYILNSEDYSIVNKRVIIADIFVLVISKLKDAVLIGTTTEHSENILIVSDKVQDALKAIQQIYYEAVEEYLPWVTEPTSDGFSQKLTEKNLSQGVNKNLWAYKVIVEYGDIGETIILVNKCSGTANPTERNLYFIMTDESIYTLDVSYKYKTKFSLTSIEKITINKKNEYIVIYEDAGVHIFTLPLSYTDIIKQECMKLGNKINIIDD